MTNGIFKSVSQRIGREKDLEDRRIKEITDELKRRCCLHEKEYGDSVKNVINLISCGCEKVITLNILPHTNNPLQRLNLQGIDFSIKLNNAN